jgi:hypothetical protein
MIHAFLNLLVEGYLTSFLKLKLIISFLLLHNTITFHHYKLLSIVA